MFRFEATGTWWQISTPQPLLRAVQQHILARVRAFESTYSRFQPDSLVTRMAQARDGGRFPFPDDALPLFELYDQLHAVTGGTVDPLVGHDLERLGYDRSYSLTPVSGLFPHQNRPCWTSDVLREGTTLITRRPVVMDVGAAGKGYLVDLIAGDLWAAGHSNFVVDGSGDLRHAGPMALQVGLEHPFNAGCVIGTVPLQNLALCASAVNRRAWGDGLHHVLNARSGQPVREIVATWAIAPDALSADGLATALFFTGIEPLSAAFDFTAVQMFRDGHAEVSRTFSGQIFTQPPDAPASCAFTVPPQETP